MAQSQDEQKKNCYDDYSIIFVTHNISTNRFLRIFIAKNLIMVGRKAYMSPGEMWGLKGYASKLKNFSLGTLEICTNL